jgi:hypothetical protein
MFSLRDKNSPRRFHRLYVFFCFRDRHARKPTSPVKFEGIFAMTGRTETRARILNLLVPPICGLHPTLHRRGFHV